MRERIQQSYSFDEFTLDLARGCLLGSNQREIKLRPKAFITLKYLVENNGRLISKDELIEAVWPDTAVTDNSLVQCLKEVREALGDKSQHYIKTVPRRGYIFSSLKGSSRLASVHQIEDVEAIRIVIDEQTAPAPNTSYADRESLSSTSKTTWLNSKKIVAVVLVAIGLAAAGRYFLVPSKSAHPQKIAVLPFRSLSNDENDKYLGLGIADTLITRLGSTREIIVRPTSSIQKYVSSDQDSITAGREQQVDAVLEGSIQRSGNKVRVTVRLLSVKDGSTLWSYQSDENFASVFSVEDSVSQKLANALALRLTGEQRQRLEKHYTDNAEAYQLYARGVFLRNQMTREALEKSVECFQKAIELDPNYALAYAGQASSNSPLAAFGFIPIREAESRNRSLVAKALQLDDKLAEAHAALGELKMFIEWDWAGAEREFNRALELNPNEPLSGLFYPDLLLFKGQTEEAVRMAKSTFEMDPLSARTGKALAHIYYYARKYDQALEQSKKTLELFPNHPLIFLGPIYEAKGMPDEAVEEYLQKEQSWGTPPASIAALRQAYVTRGLRGYWQKRLDLLTTEAKQKPVSPLQFADLYARVGDKERALEWLLRAYDSHDMSLVFIKVDPVWESLRSDQRFTDLLRRMGFTS